MCRTAFRELYCRATNPARHLMFWLPEVRRAPALFRAFRARMMQLLQEVRPCQAKDYDSNSDHSSAFTSQVYGD